MDTTTLKPGLLVSLRSSVTGNVTYRKRDLETDHVTESGEMLARWETERTIADPGEHETAIKVRSRARACITGVCAQSSFGLLCPESNASNLDAAIREARAITEAFNETARLTRVTVHVIAGRVAADDVEATRAINSEVSELLERMATGIKNLDVTAVREAANRARALGSMLTPAASERVKGAIEAARSAARKIAKAGEQASCEVDLQAMNIVSTARTAFLDVDETAHDEIAMPVEDARAVDFTPEEDAAFALADEIEARAYEESEASTEIATPSAPVPQFEIEE